MESSKLSAQCKVYNICRHISSSCPAASTDIPDPLSPLLPIIHHSWQVFRGPPHTQRNE